MIDEKELDELFEELEIDDEILNEIDTTFQAFGIVANDLEIKEEENVITN